MFNVNGDSLPGPLIIGTFEKRAPGPRIRTWDCREQIQLAVRAGLELGASGLQVQRFNRSATLPPASDWFRGGALDEERRGLFNFAKHSISRKKEEKQRCITVYLLLATEVCS